MSGKKSIKYNIKISDFFLEELDEICGYFSDNFKSVYISDNFRKKSKMLIKNLKYFPRKYAVISKKDKNGRYFRRIILNNFIILYTIISENSIIFISRIFYGKMDYFNSNFI